MTSPVMAQGDPGDRGLLTDVAGTGLPLAWYSVNDGVMGGRSSGSFSIDEGKLEFTGSLNTNGGGFASIRAEAENLELRSNEGVRLRVRGDGRTYTMRLRQRTASGRSVSYQSAFATAPSEDWEEVWLPFESFVPTWRGRILDLPDVDPSRIDGFGLMISDKIDGPFRLEVDSIHVYAPFALEDLRGKRHTLVIFAPNAKENRLLTQLAAVRAGQAAFRNRDMSLVVVLEAPGSFADRRPISTSTAEQLRKDFDIAEGDFGVRLIGKNGNVMYSEATPVQLATLYTQIDAMPLRQPEGNEPGPLAPRR